MRADLLRRVAKLEAAGGLHYDDDLAGDDLVFMLQNLLVINGRPVEAAAGLLFDRATAVAGQFDLSAAEILFLDAAYVGDISGPSAMGDFWYDENFGDAL